MQVQAGGTQLEGFADTRSRKEPGPGHGRVGLVSGLRNGQVRLDPQWTWTGVFVTSGLLL